MNKGDEITVYEGRRIARASSYFIYCWFYSFPSKENNNNSNYNHYLRYHSESGTGWWRGKNNRTHAVGWFPFNYCQKTVNVCYMKRYLSSTEYLPFSYLSISLSVIAVGNLCAYPARDSLDCTKEGGEERRTKTTNATE